MLDLLFILGVLTSMIIPSKKILMMFQQNRYEAYRYFKWFSLKCFFKENKFNFLLALFGILCFLEPSIIFLILVIKMIIDYKANKNTDYIKPLVVTNRVKRQLVVLIILDLSLISFLAVILPNELYSLIFFVSIIINELFIYFIALITTPIEKMFHNKFKRDSKKILDSYNNLIKIGITGSYGKTSSKNILQQVLNTDYYSVMSPASFNTPMGISRTIREYLTPLNEVFICEMGADHVGDIVELMNFVEPKIGIVTSIGPQHLNTFKTQENIINEKMKIIEKLSADGVGIINLDNEFIRNYKIKNQVKTITVGIDNKADYQAIDISYHQEGSSFKILYKGEKYNFNTRLLGKHNIMNILVAVAVGRYLNIDFSKLERAVSACPYIEHRLELKKINGYTFIDNAFNSNPSGAKMSLDVLKMMDNNRIIITPGLIDLGEKQDKFNYDFGQYMKGNVDIVILVGKNQTLSIYEGLKDSKFLMENVHVVDTVKDAFTKVYGIATYNDTILLENDLPDAFNN